MEALSVKGTCVVFLGGGGPYQVYECILQRGSKIGRGFDLRMNCLPCIFLR